MSRATGHIGLTKLVKTRTDALKWQLWVQRLRAAHLHGRRGKR